MITVRRSATTVSHHLLGRVGQLAERLWGCAGRCGRRRRSGTITLAAAAARPRHLPPNLPAQHPRLSRRGKQRRFGPTSAKPQWAELLAGLEHGPLRIREHAHTLNGRRVGAGAGQRLLLLRAALTQPTSRVSLSAAQAAPVDLRKKVLYGDSSANQLLPVVFLLLLFS